MALYPTSAAASEFVVAKRYHYDQRSPNRWIASHILRYPLVLLMIVVGAWGNAACAFAVPALIGVAFNAITQPIPDLQTVANCALLIVGSQIIRASLMLSRNFSSETMGQRIERDTRDELYANLLGKSMTFHTMYPVGDIMSRATNDVHELNLMFSQGINMIVGSGMFLFFPLFTAPALHPQLIIVPLGFIISYWIAIRVYSVRLKPATEAVREAFGTMNTDLAETLEGIETVKGASQEQQELRHFYNRANDYRNRFVDQSDIEAKFIPLLLLGIAEGAGLLHAILLYRAGEIQIGHVISFMGSLQMFGFPTWVSLMAYSQLQLGLAAAQRILKLVAIQTDLDQNKDGRNAPIEGDVTFENVSFGYPDGSDVLRDLTFSVKAGQTVAIVGQTGAGKSTLSKLINRTYDATQGRVLIDGVDVRDWSLESLRSQISNIEQDIFLFSRTIAENIAFGYPNATQEEIEHAAKEAQAHDFIMGFKDGYNTMVGERGVTLSGGQRQRIALARAFLTDPRILILDDSTSAIDSATEDQIQRAILKASKGRTTFLITHRLSQIRWADLIIVIRQGEIVAQGGHDDLLRESESYRRIFATYEAPRKVNPSLVN
jgi:ATP-binding cassette, subfamily B, bacterial